MNTTGTQGAQIRFESFCIDRQQRLLFQEGAVVPLAPKVYDTLLVLAENPGRLLEKEWLLTSIWPDSFVEEGSLTRSISSLRKALGGNASDQRFIQTVPKRGYRFVADTTEPALPSAVTLPEPETSPALPATPRRWIVWATAAAILLCLLAAAAAWWNAARERKASQAAALLVLPFENVGIAADSPNAYLASSLTVEITTSLSRMKGLRVVSTTTARELQSEHTTLQAMAAKAGVAQVLEGSIVQAGGTTDLELRLVNADSGQQIWSATFAPDKLGLTNVRNQVSRAVLQALHVPLTEHDAQLLDAPETKNTHAYDDYLRARYMYYQGFGGGGPDPPPIEAMNALEEAVRLDPQFAGAWVMLAKVCQRYVHHVQGDYVAYSERAAVAAQRALALDPSLAEPHETLGALYVESSTGYRWEPAVREYKTAIALNPLKAEPHGLLGLLYLRTGLLDAALRESRLAHQLDPAFSVFIQQVAWVQMVQQKYAEASATFETMAPAERWERALLLSRLGQPEEALASLDQSLQSARRPARLVAIHSAKALVLARAGRMPEARQELTPLLDNPLLRIDTYLAYSEYRMGATYALLGDNANALVYLQRAAHDGYPCYPLYATDSDLNGLRADPHFVQFLDHLHQEWLEFSRVL